MSRPVCLFTGQWADLPLATLARKARAFGYDGLELACWGDHFDVRRALADREYCRRHWELLADHGIVSFAVSNHLVGQAVCDRIDERHRAILPEHVWGDGDPEGVRRRAAAEMIDTEPVPGRRVRVGEQRRVDLVRRIRCDPGREQRRQHPEADDDSASGRNRRGAEQVEDAAAARGSGHVRSRAPGPVGRIAELDGAGVAHTRILGSSAM